MAKTAFATGHASTVTLWSAALFLEAQKQTYFKKFSGPNATDCIQTKSDLSKEDGDTIKFSKSGQLLRHAFTGVSLAQASDVPDEVCHVIAVHSKEGDSFTRTTEGLIVHHADFMTYLPFKNLKK